MDTEQRFGDEFDIVELEPRQATSPDGCFIAVCRGSGGSGGHHHHHGSGGSGGGSGT